MRDDTAYNFGRMRRDFVRLKEAATAVGLDLTITFQLRRDGRITLECETFDMLSVYLDVYTNGRKTK